MNQDEFNTLKNIEAMMAILLKRDLEPDSEDDINLEEAAKICGLSKRTLYNYMDTGKFRVPITKKGKSVLFKRQDVLRWNAERTVRMIPALKAQ